MMWTLASSALKMRPESCKQTVAMTTSQSNTDCGEGQGCCQERECAESS